MVFSGFKYLSQSLESAELEICVSQLLILFNFSSLHPTSPPRTSLTTFPQDRFPHTPKHVFLSGKKSVYNQEKPVDVRTSSEFQRKKAAWTEHQAGIWKGRRVLKNLRRTSLPVAKTHDPSTGSLGSIPGQGTRSCKSELEVSMQHA